MIDQNYYEKLGGFSYVLEELRKKIGQQQTKTPMSDDRVYGNLCGITFQRQGTLGRGSDKCDFYFYRNEGDLS